YARAPFPSAVHRAIECEDRKPSFDAVMSGRPQARTPILAIVGCRSSAAVRLQTIRSLLGSAVRACWATRPGEAAELVVRHGTEYAMLCVFGGDGTVSEVVNGLHQISRVALPPLTIFPAGTSNILARHFGCDTFGA